MDLQQSIQLQREKLALRIAPPMAAIAQRCAGQLDDRTTLESILAANLPTLFHCKHLYVLDAACRQLTANITQQGQDASHFGRDRRTRPYMQGLAAGDDFRLSHAYISRNKKRPSLTAVQVIRDASGQRIGFLGADFDLRELPYTAAGYVEPDSWRQIKGDPAIRDGLFHQQRADSALDQAMDRVLPVINELLTERGVFHCKIHFSSSRATVWLVDDPYTYRILGIDALIAADTLFAYGRRPLFERAIVPAEQAMPVLEMFRTLRFADDNIYLRSGSLNMVNGLVGLNFSCDGSHYLRYDEFLSKGLEFWFGTLGVGALSQTQES